MSPTWNIRLIGLHLSALMLITANEFTLINDENNEEI